MVAAQATGDCFFGVSDLHAMTTPHDPRVLRDTIAEVTTLFLAVGLDPAQAVLFRQSAVPAHRGLAYLLECTAYTGELGRMIQYKEKGRGNASTRVSLYTYPALMAADILLYRPTQVPVGDDQRQHVELTRDLAVRFNNTYGAVFTVPEITTPLAGARVMDLQDPGRKMSKSAAPGADSGVIRLLDPPDVVRRKIARAVTDSDTGPGAVRASDGEARRVEPARHPGRVRGLGLGHHDVRRTEGGRHRRGRRRAGAAPEEVRRPGRRPGVRHVGLRRRRRALPRGHRPRPRRGRGGDGGGVSSLVEAGRSTFA